MCPLCAGHGYLRKDVPVAHPDFGRAFPCQCMEPVLAQRRLARIFGAAAIPGKFQDTSFATYALLPGADQASRARVEAWADHGPHSLYLHGPYGHGKTGLALAAFRQRIETRQVDALYRVAPELLQAIRATFDRDMGGASTSEVVELVKNVGLLLLDDLGKEKPTDWVAEQLYTIVNHRYLAELPTIVTTNHTPQQLGAQIGQATAWRLVEMSEGYIVKVEGTNLRDRRARERE